MASSNIKLFDENKGNMLTDTEFNISNQRLNGLQTGVASSQLQNKAMYQASLVAYAIAQLMLQNGKNANDTDAVSAFVANLSGTMLQKVYDLATTEEAQTGVATGKWMSPASVKVAIDALAAKAQNILSDATKTMLGLGVDAVPNDAFASMFNIHRWVRRTYDVGYIGYVADTPDTNVTIFDHWNNKSDNDPSGNSFTDTWYYGTSFEVEKATGRFKLTGNTGTTGVKVSLQGTDALKGKFAVKGQDAVTGTSTWLNYFPDDVVFTNKIIHDGTTNEFYVYADKRYGVGKSFHFNVGDWEALASSNRNQYPDSGVVDGYQYLYCGLTFDKVLHSPRLPIGSYSGTGVYGADNKNTLVLDERPYMVLIFGKTYTGLISGMQDSGGLIVFNGVDTLSYGTYSWNGNTLSFYSTANAAKQLNTNQETYNYIPVFA